MPTPESAQPPEEQSAVAQRAQASGQARVYQAGGDQVITEVVLPRGSLPPVDQVEAPPGLVRTPHPGLFVGRDDELARLEQELERAGPPVIVAAVHGLGGVGKSTLAARYAALHAGQFNPVWWVTADSAASVQAGLAALAVALVPGAAWGLPLEELAGYAASWLGCHEDWLLILDNVGDPAGVEPLVSRVLSGRVLVTSRLGEGWHRLDASVLRLDVLTEGQAVALLMRIAGAGRAGAELQGAAALVAELGCLPLAVEQAAAYLRQARLSPAAYLELLAEQPAVMYDRAAEGVDGERTIARIWRITLDRLTDGAPLAGQLLRILAWYGAEAIPPALWEHSLQPSPREAEGGSAGKADLVHALGQLAAYNMIGLEEDVVSVHRLVQAVARTPDPADPHRQQSDITAALHQATGLLAQAAPDDYADPGTWSAWRALLPHIDALIERAPSDSDTDTTSHLLDLTGLFLHSQGNAQHALAYHQRALTAHQRLLGPNHRGTLGMRNNLAVAYEAAGYPDKAIRLHATTLADRERVLGPDDPATLSSRNNLAYAYQSAGALEVAIPLYEAILVDRERVLGPAHLETLNTRNNLANAYYGAGAPQRAVPLHEQTLTARERMLGPDAPATVESRNNLAAAYQAAGQLSQALPLYETTLADCERVLGPDHPRTLASRSNLAIACYQAGDLDRAIPLLQQTLPDREQVLGPDHVEILTTRYALATAFEATGELDQAIALYETTLTDCERALGSDHPLTEMVRENLESTRR
ncbi:FxSxx-COOH system tetratricopeptide repeat protein [Actinomadura sp. NPDC023710]|uniref:FxSxx-COOH system tetratricopeptide repeat protein n=1 Tax=Actinomadura sp. NPDC023710 TaxID=3158219 RepID=UPI0033E92D01